MQNEIKTNCDYVKAQLRPFLDDVLMEGEHAAYCAHLNTCRKCNDYVRSVGSFTNQIWKLGKVKVPGDLTSTILYRLAHASREAQAPLLTLSRRQVAVGVTFILLAALILTTAGYFKAQRRAAAARKNTIVEVVPVPGNNVRTQAFFEQQEEDTSGRIMDEEGMVEEETAVEEALPVVQGPVETPRPQYNAVALDDKGALHWHFKYPEPRMAKLSNVLSAMDIRPDYEGKNAAAFIISGEKAEQLLEQLLANARGASSFADFTPDVVTYFDKNYPVSIYLEGRETHTLHWHIDRLLPEKRSGLFEVIRELGGFIDYESGRFVVFSISDQQLENLKRRIQAMRVIVSEYGSAQEGEKILSSGPVTISVYFVK